MIGIIVGVAIVATIAAIVITDASPRPRSAERSALAPWDHLLPGSSNGMRASNGGSAEEGSAGSARSPALSDEEDPSTGLDPSSSVRTGVVPRTGSIDLVPATYVDAPLLQPDPERLIQTEVALHEAPSVRWLALARLVLGVVGFAAVVAFMMIGFARGVGFLIKKLAGG